jgi:hypothetical protein
MRQPAAIHRNETRCEGWAKSAILERKKVEGQLTASILVGADRAMPSQFF